MCVIDARVSSGWMHNSVIIAGANCHFWVIEQFSSALSFSSVEAMHSSSIARQKTRRESQGYVLLFERYIKPDNLAWKDKQMAALIDGLLSSVMEDKKYIYISFGSSIDY